MTRSVALLDVMPTPFETRLIRENNEFEDSARETVLFLCTGVVLLTRIIIEERVLFE